MSALPDINLHSSRPILDSIYRLLQQGGEKLRDGDPLLAELAEHFDAEAFGLAAMVGKKRVLWQVWPQANFDQEGPPELASATGQTIAHAGQAWLVSPAGENQMGWLRKAGIPSWPAGAHAAWSLTSLALANLAAQAPACGRWRQILEHARLQRQLDHAGVVTGRLAHDIGNVLTGILGFSELTLNQLQVGSVPHRYMREVWQAAQQGASWVRKLQLFSRRSVQFDAATALAPIVTQEEERVRPHWGPSITLLATLPTELPRLAVDADSLRQALAQILDNAREALAGPGVVTLSARTVTLTHEECSDLLGDARPGKHVEVAVTDTGAGLQPDLQRRLFHELFLSTKPRHRGLGLAVVYGILHAFQGGLRFGPHPQQGTAVRLFFPVAGTAAAVTKNGQPSTKDGARLLVVDDDPMILHAVAEVLTNVGYQVQAASSPQEALAVAQENREPFALVVSDIVMPGMSGLQMARRLLEQKTAGNFLFISSQRSFQGLGPDELLQRFDLLNKPFEPKALVRAVETALAKRRPD